MDYYQVCKIQRDLNKMISKSERDEEIFKGMYPPNWSGSNDPMQDLWDQFKALNNESDERRIDRDLRRLTNSIDRIFDKIDKLDIDKREQYLEKLKEVLGKSD